MPRDDVAIFDTTPLVVVTRPLSEEARVVVPVTVSVPAVVVVAVIDAAVSDVAVVVAKVAMLLNVAGPLNVVEANVLVAEKF